jgi:hypothetical protein
MKSRLALALAILVSALSGPALAQPSGGISSAASSAPQSPKEMPGFGTTGASSVRLTALDFVPIDNTPVGYGDLTIGRYPLGGFQLLAPVHVPGGTIITRIELDYCDTNAVGNHVFMHLVQCDNQGQNCSTQSSDITSSSNGCSFVSDNGVALHVDNYTQQYFLQAFFGDRDGTNLLTGAIVSYQLQVSPAPGAATFNDAPTSHPFFQYIEALAASGITGGCGSGNYCPDAPLTRGQMAVFLAKALGLYWNHQ